LRDDLMPVLEVLFLPPIPARRLLWRSACRALVWGMQEAILLARINAIWQVISRCGHSPALE